MLKILTLDAIDPIDCLEDPLVVFLESLLEQYLALLALEVQGVELALEHTNHWQCCEDFAHLVLEKERIM